MTCYANIWKYEVPICIYSRISIHRYCCIRYHRYQRYDTKQSCRLWTALTSTPHLSLLSTSVKLIMWCFDTSLHLPILENFDKIPTHCKYITNVANLFRINCCDEKSLTHRYWVTHIWVTKLDHHWFSAWHFAGWVPHYLNQMLANCRLRHSKTF